jgi:CRP-like cAMP-binding protein
MLYQNVAQREFKDNGVLASLDAGECHRLFHLLRVVDLDACRALYTPGDEIRHIYFPISSVVTAVATMNDGSTVETAMIGAEGILGVAAVVDSYRARYWVRVLLPGEALRVEVEVLRELFNESRACQKLLLGYYSTLINHVSRRAICNTRHRMSERLCTWLLMVHDRAGSGDLALTQETIARQLGVRRAGVNECVGWLQSLGVIDHRRGHVRLLDREALEHAACVCYPTFKDEVRWFEDVKLLRGGKLGSRLSSRETEAELYWRQAEARIASRPPLSTPARYRRRY